MQQANTPWLQVECHNLPRIEHQLCQMCRLSSRGGTHVEPALSWPGLTQGGDQHGTLILHLKQTLRITWKRIQPIGPLHNEGRRDHPRWGDVLETFVLETPG